MRQLHQYFQDSLRYSSSACDCKYHWRFNFWKSSLGNIFGYPLQCIFHCLVVFVHVSTSKEHKWSLKSFLKQEFSTSSDEIESSSNTCVSSKCNKPLWVFFVFSDALEVDDSEVQLKHTVKQRHVVALSLDSVREVKVSLTSNKG